MSKMPISHDVNLMPLLQDNFGVPIVFSQVGQAASGFAPLPGTTQQAFKSLAFTTATSPTARMQSHTDLTVDLTQFGRSRKTIIAVNVTGRRDEPTPPLIPFGAGINFNIWDRTGVGTDFQGGSGALFGGATARGFDTGSLLPSATGVSQNFGFTPNIDVSNFGSLVFSIAETIGGLRPDGSNQDLTFPGEEQLFCVPTSVVLRVTPIIDLTVKVVDTTGAAVPGATVQLLLGASVVGTTTTDSTGTVVFAGLLADFYQVIVAIPEVGQQSQGPTAFLTDSTLTFTFQVVQLATLQSQVTALQLALSQLQTSLQGLATETTARFQVSDQSIAKLRADTATAFGQVNTLIAELQTALAHLQSAEAADRADINTLRQRLENLIAALPPGLVVRLP